MNIEGTVGEDIRPGLKMIEKGKTDLRGDGASTDLNLVTGTVEE